MSSPLDGIGDESILDGCTFKLDSFTCSFPYSESLQKFLNNKSSLTNVTLYADCKPLPPFDEGCLPNLTRVSAMHSWLGELIPGRPVREVGVFSHSNIDSTDLNFFTLSTLQSRNSGSAMTCYTRILTPGIHVSLPRASEGVRLQCGMESTCTFMLVYLIGKY